MEPDLYRALRAKDIRRVRECLKDWGNENRRLWWGAGGAGGAALTPLHVASKGSSQDILRELLKHPEIGRSINTFTDKTNVRRLINRIRYPYKCMYVLYDMIDIIRCSSDIYHVYNMSLLRSYGLGQDMSCVAHAHYAV